MSEDLTLYFYIDKKHYPYHYQDASVIDDDLIQYCAPSTWLSWTFITYLHLRNIYKCKLVDTMPQTGIIFFFRGSVPLNRKPNRHQLWVCMVADGNAHPYAQINIFQNSVQHKKHKANSYFIRHWPQLNIKKSERKIDAFQNLYYFGNKDNLAEELKSDDWKDFVGKNSFNFIVPEVSRWNNYKEVDAVIAIRSFRKKTNFDNKPASKLINCWLANAMFISTKESAYMHEASGEYEILEVSGYSDLKRKLIYLKKNPEEVTRYKSTTFSLQKKYTVQRYIQDWCSIIDDISQKYKVVDKLSHTLFILKRYNSLKASTLLNNIKTRTRGK